MHDGVLLVLELVLRLLPAAHQVLILLLSSTCQGYMNVINGSTMALSYQLKIFFNGSQGIGLQSWVR
jgi:hypothetical protein